MEKGKQQLQELVLAAATQKRQVESLTHKEIKIYLRDIRCLQRNIQLCQKCRVESISSTKAILQDLQWRNEESKALHEMLDEKVQRLLELNREFPECFPEEFKEENADLLGIA